MGWKGVLRDVERAARKAKREQERREKERRKEKRRRAAASAVSRFKLYLEDITSLHKECRDPVNWETLRDQAPPEEPERKTPHEQAARERFENYQPSLLDRLLRRVESRREELRKAIDDGKKEDQRMYERVREKYEREMADWKDMKYLAERVLAGEEEVYVEIVQEINPLETLEWIEGFSSFEVHSPNVVSATINVRGNDIVPAERKRQLKSGKLSTTDMPKTKYYGYHQDYVCSSLLRAAREISAVLPTTMVVVTASTDMLDPSTGHIKQQPIVSAAIASDTMDRLNLDRIDPSDALSNFVHEMAFRKTKGFRPISPIDPAQFVDS